MGTSECTMEYERRARAGGARRRAASKASSPLRSGSTLSLPSEPCDKGSHRLAAVRPFIFLRQRQLGAGHAALCVEKVRIVTEPFPTPGFIDDRPVPPAFGEYRLRVVRVPHQNEYAIIMRTAIGDPCKIGDELRIVAPIGTGSSRIACGLNAR